MLKARQIRPARKSKICIDYSQGRRRGKHDLNPAETRADGAAALKAALDPSWCYTGISARTVPQVTQIFPYDLAFARNLGWLTDWEQQALRAKRVAIAGLGGVGGLHLLTLARFGVGAFTVADLDRFEFANFNRQFGATVSTVGHPKAEVLEAMAREINPELRIRRFDNGVDAESLDRFLDAADLFVDGLDFFVMDIRRRMFARCAERGIPAITAAPIGMGVGFLAFLPGKMSFEQYFRLKGQPEPEQFLRFLLGLAPRGLHRRYLVDPTRVDLAGHKGPSTVAGCELCAGVAGVAAVKLLLGRGGVQPAPFHYQFDAYRGRLAVTRLRAGNAGFGQRLKLAVARKMFAGGIARPAAPDPASQPRTQVEEILNLARWAPSGDNTQPWRFHVLDEETVVVHLREPDRTDIYEYRDGEPVLLSAGMLLETMRIAATGWGRGLHWERDRQPGPYRLIVRLSPQENLTPDPLLSFVPLRSVDRRPYRRRPLLAGEKQALTASLGIGLRIDWHESLSMRWQIARLSARATDIRLRIPEAYEVHRRVIDWDRAHSPRGIPASATGLWRGSLPLMRWGMKRWGRMRLLNRGGGTFSAALQLDYLPVVASSAFFVMRFPRQEAPAEGRSESLLAAGQAIQRFWLTATRLGLAMQPSLALLIFADYGAAGSVVTVDPASIRRTRRLAEQFQQQLGVPPADIVFMGRIGEPRPRLPLYRSTRLTLNELLQTQAGVEHQATDIR